VALTYTVLTGTAGKRHRKRNKGSNKKKITNTKVPAHGHFTRARRNNLPHLANQAQAVQGPSHTEDNSPTLSFTENGSATIEYCYKAVHPDAGKLAEYKELRRSSEGAEWEQAAAEEVGRLAKGMPPDIPEGTDTIRFIAKSAVPPGKTVTYLRIVAADTPHKAKSKRIRYTVGGNLLTYEGNASTKTADLTTCKILFNSIVSTPGCKCLTADLKDFYLNTRLETNEYMRIPVADIPPQVMEHYNLKPLIQDGYVYVEIGGGMYGLIQAGAIANKKLVKTLLDNDYHQMEHTPGLFRHTTRPIWFTLTVDDFAVAYVGKEHADHLLSILARDYVVATDWTGTQYCGLTLQWDYTARTVDISMPGYVSKALQRFSHPTPTRPENSPHPWQKPNYGAKTQLTDPADTSRPLEPPEKTRIQEIVGTLVYYARAVDSTMLVALSAIASAQANGTEQTVDKVVQLLNYAATHPDATVRYIASDMCLWVHSDASYLSEPQARSRTGGYFFLSDRPQNPTKPPAPDDTPPKPNGAIHVVTHLMKEVVSSAAEAETGGLFYNGKETCPLRTTLMELGFPQDATPIQTDNSTACGIANETVKQRRSKAMDMRYYWIRDRVRQGQFIIYWAKGSGNLADYFTKHHPVSHHRAMLPVYLHQANSLTVSCEGVLMTPPHYWRHP
jgi:hypothetical protein